MTKMFICKETNKFKNHRIIEGNKRVNVFRVLISSDGSNSSDCVLTNEIIHCSEL